MASNLPRKIMYIISNSTTMTICAANQELRQETNFKYKHSMENSLSNFFNIYFPIYFCSAIFFCVARIIVCYYYKSSKYLLTAVVLDY